MAGKAFWDSSALVTLLVKQEHSDRGRELADVFPEFFVWWGSSVEVRSTFARLERERDITAAEKEQALIKFARQRRSWRLILPHNRVRRIAEKLHDSYILSAADALQLAAAHVWCGSKPEGFAFVTFDKQLAKAAALARFDVHRQVAS